NGNFRTNLIKLVTFLGGIYFFLEFALPQPVLDRLKITPGVHEAISNGFIAFGVMAVGLGLVKLFVVYGSKIVFKRQGWPYAAALLIGLIGTMTIAIANWIGGLQTAKRIERVMLLADFATVIISDHKAGREGVPS